MFDALFFYRRLNRPPYGGLCLILPLFTQGSGAFVAVALGYF